MRTLARVRALSFASILGLSLNKRQLRHATDKIEREMKQTELAVAPYRAQAMVDEPAAQPVASTLNGSPLVSTHNLPSDMVAINPALFKPYEQARTAPSAPPMPVSPLAQSVDQLDNRVTRAFQLIYRLEQRLAPVSQSSAGAAAASEPPVPSNIVAMIEHYALRVSTLGDLLDAMTDRLLL